MDMNETTIESALLKSDGSVIIKIIGILKDLWKLNHFSFNYLAIDSLIPY